MTGQAPSAQTLAERVARWTADDPDPTTAAELRWLVAGGEWAELGDRFDDRLRFGTAGLRGAVGGGPNRMNRAVVRMATAALASWLDLNCPDARQAGVVVGRDARHGSAEFYEETAAVLAGAGFRVHLLEPERPTPILAFSVPHLGAAAGVMITASHNPPADNGYKLYLGDGAQIVTPVDAEIEAMMDRVGCLAAVPSGDLTGPLVVRHGPEIEQAYLEALLGGSVGSGAGGAGGIDRQLKVVYTAMHGVARRTFEAAVVRAGYPPPIVVLPQADPDPDFPTVAFPNPEEPGALDLALAEARRVGADVVVANDPDGDRLAIAVPDPSAAGGWRALRGDEVGSLLGAYELARTAGEPDAGSHLVATTIVSSTMLAKIAAAAGALYVETLTGFKWIVRAGERRPGSRFVFGYEEALGYSVGTVVRDKDGIGAALAFLGMLAEARAGGRTALDLLDDLERRHGVHLTSQLSVRTAAPGRTMDSLRSRPPVGIAGREVIAAEDLLTAGGPLPASDVLIYRMEGARVVVRPSGTEPKLKVYFEVVVSAGGGDLAAARLRAAGELAQLQSAMSELVS